jgi:phage tail sheath protein FI
MPTATYTHGSYFKKNPTSVVAINPIDSAIPFIVGAAPVHSLPYAWAPAGPGFASVVNTNLFILSYQEFVNGSASANEAPNGLGFSTDFVNFPLCGWADANFIEGPANSGAIIVNIFDPCAHFTAVTAASTPLVNGVATLNHKDIINGSVVVQDSTGATTYVRNTDYVFQYTDSTLEVGEVVVLAGGTIPTSATALKIGFAVANTAAITAGDVIGGVDSAGHRTGIQLVDDVYTEFAVVPGFVNAAGYSNFPTVNAALAAKAPNISGCFEAMAVIDVDSTIIRDYPSVAAWKTSNNLVNENVILCFPKVALAEKEYWLSTQFMVLAASVDLANNGIPFESPSNKNLPAVDRLILADGTKFRLGLQDANFLNGIGVVTARLFGQSGWVLWGNNTSAFPANTDPVARWIPVARAFNWYGGTIVQNTLQFVDKPGNPRQIQRLTDSVNIFDNSLVQQGAFIVAKTTFDPADNPLNNLLNGIFTWDSQLCVPIPMETINFQLNYNVAGLSLIFNNSGTSAPV